ncbi:MAG: YkgJ family cysteine cluster protein [Oceanicoccus sp.]
MKDCNSCGKCCKLYGDGGLSATTSEIEWWEVFRPEIYEYVSNGQIWMNPANGDQLKQCPWLQKLPDQNKYICGIYNDRPDDCKHYPVTINEMVRDECEMLEVLDLQHPAKAQKKLDKLMIDSRPALA